MEEDLLEAELKRERANGDRLSAALQVLVAALRPEDSIMHTVIGLPIKAQLTVGHVVDGALALHDIATSKRIYS